MSYSIQTKSAVLFLPQNSPDWRGRERLEEDLFWFTQSCDNNVSPFTPRWTFRESGWSYTVVQEVCRLAGSCEGGMLKFGTHPGAAKWITPETYIADYRERAKEKRPLTLGNLRAVRHGTIGFGNIKKSLLDDPAAWTEARNIRDFDRDRVLETVAALQNEYEREKDFRYGSPGDEETFTFRQKVTQVDDFLRWINYRRILRPLGIWTVQT